MTDPTPDTAGTNGAAAELSAKDKRKLREQARREAEAAFKAAEVERLKAERGITAAPAKPAPAPAVQPAPAPDVPADAVLASWAAVFLRGVLYPVISLGARLFGGRLDLDRYTVTRAEADASAWVPLLREYSTLRALVKWTTVPARVVATARELFKRDEEARPS